MVGLVRPPGRPKGSRNRITKEIRAIAGKYSHRAIRSVWKLAQHAENLDVQLKALTLILAYAHGRPVDRQETTGKDGAPLHPPEYSDREWARRLAYLLTKPGTGGADVVAELTGTDGSAGTAHVPDRAGGEDTAVGETPAPSGPSAPAPSRSNGAANAAARGGGGPLSDPGASEPTQHPVSGFEKFSPKKAIPPTEPVEGQTARVAGYAILCGPPQRPGLSLSYRITNSDGKLLTMATDGWQGALRWIKARVGDDADMSIDIIQPAPTAEPIRPDQRQFAVGGPDIEVLRG